MPDKIRESNQYAEERHGEKGRIRHGSPVFYQLLSEMAETHDRKSHDYASDDNPSGNYHYAGQMALLFSHSPQDAGFVGRMGEKLFRIANLESSGKIGITETIEDTERDICVITALWIADRRERRSKMRAAIEKINRQMRAGEWSSSTAEPDKKISVEEEMSRSAFSHIIDAENALTIKDLKDTIDYLQVCLDKRSRPTSV